MGNRVRKGQGGGMMKSPISMILVMIFIFIAIGGIASQGGVLSDIGKSLADLLNPNKPTIADFELAKKSTDVLTCAVASSFLGEEWSGSSSVNCDYGIKKSAKVEGKIIAMGSEGPITIPNTLNTDIGSSSSITGLHVGKVTGAASGDEIELTVDEARKLTPMVECTKDNGKVTGCTVKNFLLPQEIDSWEEWILYWGDPQFAVYWNMFPVEEDTWNFDIEWGHHAVIFGLSLLPWGRLFGTGASATATLVRGPGKKLIARELAEPIVDGFTAVSRNAFKANMDEFVEFTVLKTAREQVLRKFSKEGIAASESIIKQEIDKLLPTLTPSVRASLGLTDEVVEKVFTVGVKGMKESDITQFARGLQNFDKKTLLKMA
ncbi:MAG: hypothetical protein KAS04_01975, partial [Candidatus Aenigmarchaeota archaeon]|nr:hypothetical protein [Candidatus Aenigmarchaeota archaeon]